MEEQKINVCRALAAMFSDHEATEEELAFIGQTAAHLGLDEGGMKAVQQAIGTDLDFDQIVSAISDPMLRRFLFSQVVAAALTDDQLSDGERAYVDTIAKAYGWDSGDVGAFVETKQRVIDLERQAHTVLSRLG